MLPGNMIAESRYLDQDVDMSVHSTHGMHLEWPLTIDAQHAPAHSADLTASAVILLHGLA